MATITTNAAHLIKRFTRLEQFKRLKARIKAAGVHVKGKIAKYPDGNQHRSQPFKSDKQRRGFFYHLKQGNIEVPYRRGQSPGSEALGRKWTTKSINSGFGVKMGNNVSYGRLVQGDKQTAYHAKTGWKTTDQVADEERDTVNNYLLEGIQQDLQEF